MIEFSSKIFSSSISRSADREAMRDSREGAISQFRRYSRGEKNILPPPTDLHPVQHSSMPPRVLSYLFHPLINSTAGTYGSPPNDTITPWVKKTYSSPDMVTIGIG
jgi:hypothetical protein